MKTRKLDTKNIAVMGLCLCLALILSYVETLIPFSIGIPGIKLGLANAAIVFVLYYIGDWQGAVINILRVLLSGLIFGNMYSIIYSMSGAILSTAVMILIKRLTSLSPISVSAAGGVTHNIGQLIAAAITVENIRILYYVPVLVVAGIIFGLLVGAVVYQILKRLLRDKKD